MLAGRSSLQSPRRGRLRCDAVGRGLARVAALLQRACGEGCKAAFKNPRARCLWCLGMGLRGTETSRLAAPPGTLGSLCARV